MPDPAATLQAVPDDHASPKPFTVEELLDGMSDEERGEVEAAIDRNDEAAGLARVLTRVNLGLKDWDLAAPPRMVGDSLDLYLAHPQRGEVTLTFLSVREFTTQATLTAKLAVECGRRGKPPTMENIYNALALIGELAVRHESATEDQRARSVGQSFLDHTTELAFVWDDQEARWEAFEAVEQARRTIAHNLRAVPHAARHGVVLEHAVTLRDSESGWRTPHAGWLLSHARADTTEDMPRAAGQVSTLMQRAGWLRPPGLKIETSKPGARRTRHRFPVYKVPPGWDDD